MNPFDTAFKAPVKKANPFDAFAVPNVSGNNNVLNLNTIQNTTEKSTPTTIKKEPFANTPEGIIFNTVLGLPQATVTVGKGIAQGIARSVASVGVTAGNLPTQVVNKLTGKNISTPFASEIPTTDSKFASAIFGGQPVKTVQQQSEDVKTFLKPYVGESISKNVSLPLVVGSILLDLSGFSGKAGVTSFTKGEIPEAFFKFMAKEESPEVIKNTLRSIGLDDIRGAMLAEKLAPTKTVDEVKQVLLGFENTDTASQSVAKNLQLFGDSVRTPPGVSSTLQPLNSEAQKVAQQMAKEYAPMNEIAGKIYQGGYGLSQKEATKIAQEAITVKPIAPTIQTQTASKEEIISAIGELKTTCPSCVIKLFDTLKENPNAVPVRGIFATDVESAVKSYEFNLSKGNQKQLGGFTHVTADVGGKTIDNNPPLPEGAKFFSENEIKNALPVGEENPISQVDKLITEGKIRVVSRNNRDTYQVKKAGEWVNTRDESSAITQVTKEPAPKKEISPEIQNQQIALEIKKETLAQSPAKQLNVSFGKSSDTISQQLENAKGTPKATKIEDKIIELGYKDTEAAQKALDSYKQQRVKLSAEGRQLALSKREKAIISAAETKKAPIAQVSKEEAQSLEDTAQQSLNRVNEPFQKEVSSLKKIIVDTSTNVKQKVGALDYWRTPDRVLKKIGLDRAARLLRHGYDSYLKELPEHLKVITDWSKQVSKEGNVKIFKFLDGQKVELNPEESKVVGEVKQYLAEWADRLGLPDDNKITHYITHIFDLGTNAKEFDEDLAKLIKGKVPGSVYDPFLEKRLGAKGYVEDTWRALDAYVKRAVRKANMDPALEVLKADSAKLEESQLNYVTKLGARINMRPTEWDNLLDNTIKQIVGYRFGQRPTAVISSTLRRMVSRGALGLNIGSAVKNLTQGVNTFAKLGVRDTLTGYINLLKPGMSKELEDTGVLAEGFIQDRTLSATKQLLQKADKGLYVMFQLAEKINRGSAYFGAKSKAIREGMDEMKAVEYAKKVVADTQFLFGSIDTPLAMQGDIAKTLFQFGSFSQKQTEFLIEMAKKKEYAGLVRYIIGSLLIVATVGKVFNIKLQDFNPLNYFSRFGTPPSLALPIAVFKAVANVPDQYGKVPPLKTKVKNVINSGKTLIPGGIQLDRTLKGNILGKTGSKKATVEATSGNPFNSF